MIARWAAWPRVDWVAAVVVILGWRLARFSGLAGPLDLTAAGRKDVYFQAGAVAVGAIALFVVPATLALALAPRERLQRILSHKHGQLRRAVIHAGSTSIALALLSVPAIALDATAGGFWPIRVLAPGLFVATGLGLVRVLYVLAALLTLQEEDAKPSMADDIRPIGSRKSA